MIWEINTPATAAGEFFGTSDGKFVVFVRSGDSVTATSTSANTYLDVWYRQIADVNGNLVNPLGFSFA